VTLVLLAGCTGQGDRAQPPAPAAAGCDTAVKRGPLPTWARAGFTPPDQATIHVQGARGEIVGVLFGWPLTAPPSGERQNKILWVARTSGGGDPLKIAARLVGSEWPWSGRPPAVWRGEGGTGRVGADRARWGASGALYPQTALAGLNPCPRVRVRRERRARSVDGQVPRNVTL
jgi:hypothetical protein